jgi:hypothetical protein
MLVNWRSDERRQALTTLSIYQRCAMHGVLDVIDVSPTCVIGSLIEL